MYFRKWLIILVVLDFILTQVCWGQEGFSFDKELFIESAKETKILKIGLVDCIVFALKNNSEIKIKKIEPLIDDGNIKVAKAEFEPSLTLDGSMGETKKQSANSTAFSPPISKTRTRELNVGLGGKFITGTEYDIDFINKKDISNATYRIINPYYESQAAITITQPLLEGFGITVNRADIIIASNNKVKSKENFKKEVIDVVSKTKELYYNYVLFLEQYKVAEVSLKKYCTNWLRFKIPQPNQKILLLVSGICDQLAFSRTKLTIGLRQPLELYLIRDCSGLLLTLKALVRWVLTRMTCLVGTLLFMPAGVEVT